MSAPLVTPDVRADYQGSLDELTSAIEWNQGNFSLILAHCNSPRIRQRALWELEHRGTFSLRTVTLPHDAELMFSSIRDNLAIVSPSPDPTHAALPVSFPTQTLPNAIAIAGFEAVTHLEALLASADTVRDELRKAFHCPLVWWMDDFALVKLIRLAPHIHSWFTFVEFPSAAESSSSWLANPLAEPQPTQRFEPSAAQREPSIAPCLDRYPTSSPWSPQSPSPAIATSDSRELAS